MSVNLPELTYWFSISLYILFIIVATLGIIGIIMDAARNKNRLLLIRQTQEIDLEEQMSKIDEIIASSKQLNLQTSQIIKKYEKGQAG